MQDQGAKLGTYMELFRHHTEEAAKIRASARQRILALYHLRVQAMLQPEFASAN